MRVLGSWPPISSWPGPPKTPQELFRERKYTQVYCFHLRHANVNKALSNAVQGCWFLCRYGMQRYAEVITWPMSDLYRAMDSLGFWIEKETPKTRAGPS